MFVKTPTPDYIKTIFTMHALVGTKNITRQMLGATPSHSWLQTTDIHNYIHERVQVKT